MGQVQVKNVSSATVVITAPDVRLRRDLAPGRTISLSTEEFEELSFDPGIQSILRAGYLKVTGKDEESKKIVEDAVEQPADETVLSVEQIRKIYTDSDVTTFAKTIANASPATRETMVKLAVEMNVTLPAFTALIKKYCNVDVIQAITYARQAAEKD
jgi:hypothetical protein